MKYSENIYKNLISASFEPTIEENAQIQADKESSSNVVDTHCGYACPRCGKLFSYAYYR